MQEEYNFLYFPSWDAASQSGFISPEDAYNKNYEQTQKEPDPKRGIVHIKEEGIDSIKDRNHSWPYYEFDL